MRVFPDISAVGDPNTGMLIGQTQTFPDGSVRYSEYRIGGTSLSSPLAAGMLALAVQRRGAPIGFANPALDRKSTRLNSSHLGISYAVFCLKKKKTTACHHNRY